LRGADQAPKILLHDHIGRGLAPRLRDLHVFLLEVDLAPLPRDGGGAELPLDLVERIAAGGREVPRDAEASLSSGGNRGRLMLRFASFGTGAPTVRADGHGSSLL